VWASDHFGLLTEFEVPVHPPGAWAKPPASPTVRSEARPAVISC
jgi:hypothetical protein